MPVTGAGFTARTENEILEAAEVELATVQDPDSGEFLQPDFTSDDPVMQVAKVPLGGVARAEDATKLIYDQFDPSNATGVIQSGQVQLNGIRRQDESASVFPFTATGTAGFSIPAGSKVSDEQETFFFVTDQEVTFDVSGSASGTMTCETNGSITFQPNELTKIITPEQGWDSVTNGTQLSVGQLEETDEELRKRQRVSTAAPSVSLIDGLYANLLNTKGVTYARCYQNSDPQNSDSRGILPATLACVVVGGTDEDVAKTIFTRYAMNRTQGNTLVTFFDLQGESYNVRFDRAIPVNIVVELDIEVYNQNVFPSDGDEQIKQAIIAYAQDGAKALGIEDGFEDGFNPGVTIEYSRLYTPINSVPGHRVTRLEIAIDGQPLSDQPIPVAFNEIGTFLESNITVTEV